MTPPPPAAHPDHLLSVTPLPERLNKIRSGPSRSPRIWVRRAVIATLVGGGLVVGWKYGLSKFLAARVADKPLTAVVQRGELKITITDHGELESIDAVQVSVELQGGGKLVSIVDEGKRVKKGDEVAKLDPDAIVKLLNDQDVKWQTAGGKVKSCVSELAQAKNKAEGEIADADLALILAEIDLESYDAPQGEYKRDVDKNKGALELKKKDLKEAEDDYKFTKGLVKDGYAQLEQLRAKELRVAQGKYEVTSAEAELRLLELFTRKKKITELSSKAKEAGRKLTRTKETQKAIIEKAESELKSARVTAEIEKKQLDRLSQQVDRCTIVAPSEGIVVYSKSS